MTQKFEVFPGTPQPLGATFRSSAEGQPGTNFALFSAHATQVDLCLFSPDEQCEIARLPLPEHSNGIWHGFVANLPPGTLYGYRVHGPYAPRSGHRFNPAKLLIDPYARSLSGKLRQHPALFGYVFSAHDDKNPDRDLRPDPRDSAPYMPKAVVGKPVKAAPPRPKKPAANWADSIIYELHPSGMTAQHPDIEPSARGTLQGLRSPPLLLHLSKLGITAVGLMPLFAFADEPHLWPSKLQNAWGYNPYQFFCLHEAYSTAPDKVRDCQKMVDAFHQAGIEVLLDVVYNHTAEGDRYGPTLSLRGIDNASYYRLEPDNLANYVNDTGCGNSLDLGHPATLRLVMDSLRYWASDIGVDGFRFDLATTLARRPQGFSPEAPFLAALSQDPVLSGVKLIAEPWDLGPGGYQLGAFPPQWSEWNDQFRDDLRRFWRGDETGTGKLAARLSGSHDIFGTQPHKTAPFQRAPQNSINFITAHDGFTLQDLVSFDRKHNDANLEGNRDGHSANFSQNCGHEGPSDNPGINTLRALKKRNLLASLMLSQGVPMLRAGDELGHSQNGNNNAYCQSLLGWIDWSKSDDSLTEFVAMLTALRKAFPQLRSTQFLTGEADVTWLQEDGTLMSKKQWEDKTRKFIGFHLAALPAQKKDRRHILIYMSASDTDISLTLPSADFGERWDVELDTNETLNSASQIRGKLRLVGPSVLVLSALAKTAAKAPNLATNCAPFEQTSLTELSAAYGILPHYRSLSGEVHHTGCETQLMLCRALALEGQDLPALEDKSFRSAVQAKLHRQAEMNWRRLLPPVHVVRQNTIAWPLTLPAADVPNGQLRGALILEDGTHLHFLQRTKDLPIIGSGFFDGKCYMRLSASAPEPLPLGYHQLKIELGTQRAEMQLIVCPRRCYLPKRIKTGHKIWGFSGQLYGLQSDDNWGIGDFSDLKTLVQISHEIGAECIGINPLHALFPAQPNACSPYAPSSRLHLNPLYLDVTKIPEWDAAQMQLPGELRDLRRRETIDYSAVQKLKSAAFDRLFARFEQDHPRHSGSPRRQALEAFKTEHGQTLQNFSAFEALHEHFGGRSSAQWPSGLQNPHSDEVAAFLASPQANPEKHTFLQFECRRQLEAAGNQEMAPGLYGDLAVGVSPIGADAWADQALFAQGATIGAPPDPFSPTGQNWGQTTYTPNALMASRYRPFVQMLRVNMRGFGALRLDHAMALERLFFVPEGASPQDGAYIRYPAEELRGILALESRRAACIVVGEDLGTLPDGFQARMEKQHILSYRVMPFARFADGFYHRPDTYPAISLATSGSHDMPTILGYWSGADIMAQHKAGVLSDDEATKARNQRVRDRKLLKAALCDQGVLPKDFPETPELSLEQTSQLVLAVQRFLARSPALLQLVNLEDALLTQDQVNLPGTTEGYPNWQLKLPKSLTALAACPTLAKLCRAIAKSRANPETV